MAPKAVRVVIEVFHREVRLHLFTNSPDPIESERFGLQPEAKDIAPLSVGRDVFNLLYQCALDSVVEE